MDPVDANVSDGGKAASAPTSRLLLEKVQTAMDTLPDNQRIVLSLIAIEGHSYREAAEMLDISIGTVMSRLSRARQKLAPLANSEGAMQ